MRFERRRNSGVVLGSRENRGTAKEGIVSVALQSPKLSSEPFAVAIGPPDTT
jgi:hypothetical protein